MRIYWVEAGGGQYGETRAIDVNGRRGAAVFVRPDTDALGPYIAKLARSDALFRDTIVYLTCVHQLGHALGLRHTANFADVMYFFGFGGDIPRFFMRYREQLGEARSTSPRTSRACTRATSRSSTFSSAERRTRPGWRRPEPWAHVRQTPRFARRSSPRRYRPIGDSAANCLKNKAFGMTIRLVRVGTGPYNAALVARTGPSRGARHVRREGRWRAASAGNRSRRTRATGRCF